MGSCTEYLTHLQQALPQAKQLMASLSKNGDMTAQERAPEGWPSIVIYMSTLLQWQYQRTMFHSISSDALLVRNHAICVCKLTAAVEPMQFGLESFVLQCSSQDLTRRLHYGPHFGLMPQMRNHTSVTFATPFTHLAEQC